MNYERLLRRASQVFMANFSNLENLILFHTGVQSHLVLTLTRCHSQETAGPTLHPGKDQWQSVWSQRSRNELQGGCSRPDGPVGSAKMPRGSGISKPTNAMFSACYTRTTGLFCKGNDSRIKKRQDLQISCFLIMAGRVISVSTAFCLLAQLSIDCVDFEWCLMFTDCPPLFKYSVWWVLGTRVWLDVWERTRQSNPSSSSSAGNKRAAWVVTIMHMKGLKEKMI